MKSEDKFLFCPLSAMDVCDVQNGQAAHEKDRCKNCEKFKK